MKEGFEVRRFADAGAFLDRAQSWLLEREAEHNLILGLARSLAQGDNWYEDPIYMATVERAGAIVGVAFRTPPFKLSFSLLPEAALPALEADVASVYTSLPAVMGPKSTGLAFAKNWTARSGGNYALGREQRIFQATSVRFPDHSPDGQLRPAGPEDAELVARWIGAFLVETSLPGGDPAAAAARLIASRSMYLWDDGVPHCMIAAVGPTPHGIRIGYVYTPPSSRNRGYASFATATLTHDLLAGGRKFCFLYTDLANPISNTIYSRIGYEPVCDVVDIDFID